MKNLQLDWKEKKESLRKAAGKRRHIPSSTVFSVDCWETFSFLGLQSKRKFLLISASISLSDPMDGRCLPGENGKIILKVFPSYKFQSYFWLLTFLVTNLSYLQFFCNWAVLLFTIQWATCTRTLWLLQELGKTDGSIWRNLAHWDVQSIKKDSG